MISFLKKFLRGAALFIGGLVLFGIFMGILSAMIMRTADSLPEQMVLRLNMSDPVSEAGSASSSFQPLPGKEMTVQDFTGFFDAAAKDERVKGILVHLATGQIDLAHIQEMRAAVQKFRAAGKFADLYTSSFSDLGSGIGTYYLASAFDEIWMQPGGFVSLTGIALEMPFAKGALDKIGARAEFLQREEYKTAMESFTRENISPQNREMLSDLLGSISARISGDLVKDRGLSPEGFEAALNQGLITGDEAVKRKLINGLSYKDALEKEIAEKNDVVREDNFVDADVYWEDVAPEAPVKEEANVVLVRVAGEIIPGAEYQPGFATGAYIADAIHEAADLDHVKAIIVRVDSPGGAPSASEEIRHAIVAAKEKGKKVFVSMGGMAASGGYWVSVNADRIFALPSTLTGSIGVIMGKLDLSQLWDKVGITWGGASWGENAKLWSMTAPLDASGRAALERAIDDTYDGFIARVAEGREMKPEAVRVLAKGCVWTGLQAKENGLVDEIGGLEETKAHTAEVLKLGSVDDLRIVELPEPLSPLDQIMLLLEGQVSAADILIAPFAKAVMTMERGGPVQIYDPALPHLQP